MTDEMPFYETVKANIKVSQKQDISYDLQDKINPLHPVNPVKKNRRLNYYLFSCLWLSVTTRLSGSIFITL